MTDSTGASLGGGLRDGLQAGLKSLGLDLSEQQVAQLLSYIDLIAKWGKVYNLTAVRQPSEMLTHHLLDSLAVIAPLRAAAQGRAIKLLDVGSGAGLPGVVIAICCPDMTVHCVDTVAKKAAFIQQVAVSLQLSNLKGVHERVERLAGHYDIVTSRAFASLQDFVTLSSGTLAAEGVWLAMKGKHPAEEIANLPAGIDVFHVEQLKVPGLDADRCLIWMKRAAAVT
ncbi:16S rRNA (guanine(527)-N(7))-methyltransferase RsmG [Caenimonas koreensis DSM 17982]|uniref:Ribosomal RNA small subunit methyltransferase G n=1 Tax=Caenimonas koreensis DSM 17982 TaxID=1121255 RepID=A0A844AR57_9BURK|nr:16S rRNA (guanine(527)-N(7))-methyltransferase RsmG [Caenimonas koreensis]MRD46810.1 16S rRNA (guanine(527)-N(7))-methyltransferase RsmG [Caenimonas koreensis DSM 17982]